MLKTTIKRKLQQYIDPYFLSALKKYVNIAEINFNAILGRHFILDPRYHLFIETTGVCNLSCRFCAYSKKEIGKVVMPMKMFQEVVNQSVEMGFSSFNLTPTTGEVFMDKNFIEKMQYLDRSPKVEGYSFYTNFVIPSRQQIEELFKLRKLKSMHVSLYGHDEKSFCSLTQQLGKQYYKLVENLRCLCDLYHKNSFFELGMSWRTIPSFVFDKAPNSELQEIVWEIKNKYQMEIDALALYDNWGGFITNEDVKDIGLRVKESSLVYKKGVCTLILDRVIVLADGRVNACACRDVNGSLIIGNIKEKLLSDILSIENPLYGNLIQEQMDNKFKVACKECSYYRSIYQPLNRAFRGQYYNLDQVKKFLKRSEKMATKKSQN